MNVTRAITLGNCSRRSPTIQSNNVQNARRKKLSGSSERVPRSYLKDPGSTKPTTEVTLIRRGQRPIRIPNRTQSRIRRATRSPILAPRQNPIPRHRRLPKLIQSPRKATNSKTTNFSPNQDSNWRASCGRGRRAGKTPFLGSTPNFGRLLVCYCKIIIDSDSATQEAETSKR